MDTSREYIEMSRALPDEMLSAWEPHAGDFVFAIHGFSDCDHRKESDNGVLGIITKVQDDTFSIKPIGEAGAVAWYSIKHSIPIWRQDQLQDMLDVDYWELHYVMYHFMQSPYIGVTNAIDLSSSMEQLWLMMVVDEKYSKKWNSDKKEWM